VRCRPIVMTMSVSLSVLQRRPKSKAARPNFAKFVGHVACGRGSVLLWRRWCLCISSLVDDVMFSYHVANGSEEFASWTSDNYSVRSSSSQCGTEGRSLLSMIDLFCFKFLKKTSMDRPKLQWNIFDSCIIVNMAHFLRHPVYIIKDLLSLWSRSCQIGLSICDWQWHSHLQSISFCKF